MLKWTACDRALTYHVNGPKQEGFRAFPHEILRLLTAEGEDMLATIAVVLIVLWLLGFFAFHVGSGLIHIVLVVGLIVLVLHFLRGR